MKYIYKFLFAAIILFIVDLLWLFTGGQYAIKIAEKIQRSPIMFRSQYAGFVYLFLAYMLLETKSYLNAFAYGVCIYGVYDFTTLAIFKDYDFRFGIADTIWGGLLFVVAKYILTMFGTIFN